MLVFAHVFSIGKIQDIIWSLKHIKKTLVKVLSVMDASATDWLRIVGVTYSVYLNTLFVKSATAICNKMSIFSDYKTKQKVCIRMTIRKNSNLYLKVNSCPITNNLVLIKLVCGTGDKKCPAHLHFIIIYYWFYFNRLRNVEVVWP